MRYINIYSLFYSEEKKIELTVEESEVDPLENKTAFELQAKHFLFILVK